MYGFCSVFTAFADAFKRYFNYTGQKFFGVHYRFSTPLAVIGLVVISASIIFGIYKAMNPIVRTETVAASQKY